ncbi:MAG TPA: DNA topoisomerase IV subunit B, partial [Candidatus Vogelbacteria bacterium]|nr:DNA topoisomerase IV subunit B [Candidatus Vogelbacteria bacterium]
MPKKEENKRKYSAENITVLEGLEPVRKRPGMYIGSTGPDGLHHLLVEIFDNSRDEAMNGFASEIEIALLPDGLARIVDDGTGIPIDIHSKTKVSALETVMTTLHAGGKFDDDGYKISGGLHGVGASVVNALSEWFRAEVHRDGGHYLQEYKKGVKQADVKKIAKSNYHGTIITFKPDNTIFSETIFDLDRLISHMRHQAYLVRGLRIRMIDARDIDKKIDLDKVFYLSELNLNCPSYSFHFDGGLKSLINYYNRGLKTIHKEVFYVEKEFNK